MFEQDYYAINSTPGGWESIKISIVPNDVIDKMTEYHNYRTFAICLYIMKIIAHYGWDTFITRIKLPPTVKSSENYSVTSNYTPIQEDETSHC